MVLPVFCYINSSDLRNQAGIIEQAFVEHESKVASDKEKAALA